MPLSDSKENAALSARLSQMIVSGRIFHGYIFEGPDEETKEFAEEFAKAALCEKHDGHSCGVCLSCRKFQDDNNEDVVRFGTEGSIKDKDVEALISRSIKKSFTGKRVFILIRNADSMTLRAQNRLLKTLEEPPEGVTIILMSENSEALVQTIRSRCQIIKLFSRGIEKNDGTDAEFHERAINAAEKILRCRPYYELLSDVNFFTESKQTAQAFIETAETFYRDILLAGYERSGRLIINKENTEQIAGGARRFSPEFVMSAISSAEMASKDLSRNVSAGHALKYMIFDIQQLSQQEVQK